MGAFLAVSRAPSMRHSKILSKNEYVTFVAQEIEKFGIFALD